jgi:hypothetical protein
MERMCKWTTTGVLLAVFISLISIVGCGFHPAEFFGSILVAIAAARLFYIGICKTYSDHFSH